MRRALALVFLGVLACGPSKKEGAEPDRVKLGEWAKSNVWSLRVDSVKERRTPGMDRYYVEVFAVMRNESDAEEPMSPQILATVYLAEERQGEMIKYPTDDPVTIERGEKLGRSLDFTAKPGEERPVYFAFNLPASAEPTLLIWHDGMGKKLTLVELGRAK